MKRLIILLALLGAITVCHAQSTSEQCRALEDAEDPVTNQPCGSQENKQQCEETPACCWHSDPNRMPFRCFVGHFTRQDVSGVRAMVSSMGVAGLTETDTANFRSAFVDVIPDLPIDDLTASEISTRAIGFGPSSSFDITQLFYPECPVRVPLCQRTACNAHLPGAESNPTICLSNPICCFDRNLFIYKSLFGPNYLGRGGVCHHGPTSSIYQQIVSGFGPMWHPLFQEAVVDIFASVIDNSILSIQRSLSCSINELLGPLTAKCGWRGITPNECAMRGCCYSTRDQMCAYPTRLPNQLVQGQQEFYPELLAESFSETQCQSNSVLPSFNENIFRRLPCRCFNESDDPLQSYTQCQLIGLGQRSQSCCTDILALIPGIAGFSARGAFNPAALSGFNPLSLGGFGGNSLTSSLLLNSLGTGGFNLGALGGLGGLAGLGGLSGGFQNNPAFLLAQLLGNPSTQISLSSYFCPYFYLPLQFLPDLSSVVDGCCDIPLCYHRKVQVRQAPVFGSWTQWANVGTCSVACGQGQITRTRICVIAGTNQQSNSCAGPSQESVGCQGQSCGSWGQWSAYSNCNAPCGRTGRQTSNRVCSGSGCSGQSQRTRNCQSTRCWSNWGQYSACSVPCGSGTQSRRRTCSAQFSQQCQGSSSSSRNCQGNQCFSWAGWGNWEGCTTACTRTRTQRCRNGAGSLVDPSRCPGNTQTRSEECFTGACLAPNVPWVSWNNWVSSPCSVTCGSGTRTRTRDCFYRGRSDSPISRQLCECAYPGQSGSTDQPCQLEACFGVYTWTQWAAIEQCSSECRARRERTCRNSQNNEVAGSLCGGPTADESSCDGGFCSFEPWAEWGLCDCGSNQEFRIRCSLNNGCTGSNFMYEARPCLDSSNCG